MVKSNSIDLTRRVYLAAALGLLALGAGLILTQTAAAQDNANEEAALLSAEALDELVGPIALYPDDLIGIVLPASTYPLQIVQAARFLENRTNDSTLEPDTDWDDSVVALLNYPDVVKLMNDDLDWTWELGDAVLNQRAQVLDAIQDFRDRAYAAGNLRSDDRQVVSNDDGVIAIAPADPEVIYVPYYEPERVVVYQTVPVYHYYPWAYPVYYYPYPAGYSFSTGYFWGVTSAFVVGWNSHYLHVHHHGYYGHPYYGRRYYDPFYVRHGININVNINRGNVWEPSYHRAARPFARSEGRRVAGTSPRDAGVRPAGGYRYRDGSPQTRTFARPEERRSQGSGNPTAARRNPNTVERNAQIAERADAVTPNTTPRAYGRTDAPAPNTTPRAYRRAGTVAPTTTPRAYPRAEQPRASAARVNPAPRIDARPNVSRRSEGAPRTFGGVANGQPRYRSESPAPSAGGDRSSNRDNQSQPTRGARTSGRQSSR
ncbi:MAG TPA: DUF3300 domain-containing protein [Gammaproteobacteria bacterium]|nr:DUF3300 domain-containing protein [Gammaproteobacteria bacterium]